MRKIFYNYFLPYRNFFKDSDVETFSSFKEFRENWIQGEECIIIIPVQTFDLVGLDIRFVFREYDRDDSKKFILIGTRKQIEFSLSQNHKFLKNMIDELVLPYPSEVIEPTLKLKIERLEKRKKYFVKEQ